MGKKELHALEDGLSGSSALLPDIGVDKFNFIKGILPMLLREYEAARTDVAELELTELVEAAINSCVELSTKGRRLEAQDLLIDACVALRERSGRMDEFRAIYKASNDNVG